VVVVGCTRVFGVLVDGGSVVLFWDEFFHFPVVLFCADGEFEILASNRVPVLVIMSVNIPEKNPI
jgi:hypothetical protein